MAIVLGKLQFHADRDEIASMVLSWAAEMGLHVAVERFFPVYRLELVP